MWKGGHDEIQSEKCFENTTICVNSGRSRERFNSSLYCSASPLYRLYPWRHPQNLELQEGNSEGGFFERDEIRVWVEREGGV